jgi:hypothetical protein
MAVLANDSQEVQKALSKLIAKTWLDEGLKQRLLSDPVAVLEENDLTVPGGVQVRVKEAASVESLTATTATLDCDNVYNILLPFKPAELEDTRIQSWAAGSDLEFQAPSCI